MRVCDIGIACGLMNHDSDVFVTLFRRDGTAECFAIDSISDNGGHLQINITEEDLTDTLFEQKREDDTFNVLSLFDGMSCGQIALNRAGIKYDNYYASEIDKYAIKITQQNYPDTIQIGGVTGVKSEKLPKIDLLIGGSPCQGFSIAGKKLNFSDSRSKLFFEYVRLKEELKPQYFLLENVKMKKEFKNIISEYLQVNPILINSNLVSAQNRERLYWTNIPNIKIPADKCVLLKDIYDYDSKKYQYINPEKTKNRIFKKQYMQYDINGTGHGSQDQRAYYLHGKHGCLDTGAEGKAKILENDNRVRKITRNEAERLQTVPDNYTISVSESKAKKTLGNGWTVDVIAHIFKNIKKGSEHDNT